MAEISLVRIDSRMIHGQVCTSWLGALRANKIVLIDDSLVNDPVLSQVLMYAAPANVPLELKSTDQAAEEYKKDQFGSGRVFVIFKDVKNARDAYFKGFQYEELQVGGIAGGKPGKFVVHENISIDKEEAELLQEIGQDGCGVYFQMLPFSSKKKLDDVLSKYFKELI